LEQLKSYCNAEGAPIAVWTNGGEVVILHREDPNIYRSIPDLPRVTQTLSQVINERVTIDELAERNKLVIERLSPQGCDFRPGGFGTGTYRSECI
jgi:type I restriction enzyme M protein